MGCHLIENSAALPKRKYSFLPILTVLFLIAYGLMTMLIIEQGNTINSQQLLIRQLFSDSVQLSKLKGEAARKQQAGAAPSGPQGKPEAKIQPERKPEGNARPQFAPKVIAPQAPADERRMTTRI